MASFLFNQFKAEVMKGLVDLSGHTIKCSLHTALPGNADTDGYAALTNEVVAGGGYSAGGATLAGKVVAADDVNDRGTWDADDVVWAASTITAAYAVLYDDSHAGKALLACIDFGGTQISSDGNFTIRWSVTPSAIITLT
jgi:hypothetical protein